MLRLTRGQRTMLADKVLDAANVAAGALVFGQFLADRFSLALAIVGLALWSILALLALALITGGEQ
jgi:hypothetical protein